MLSLLERDRWYVSLIWLAVCSFAADWARLHYMVGAVMDAHWFDQPVHRPAHQLGDGWSRGIPCRRCAAGRLGERQAGRHSLAGKILKWGSGEASFIGWLLQTKALITIIFRQHLAGQGHHHQRNFHGAAMDGRRQYHDHRTRGLPQVAARFRVGVQAELKLPRAPVCPGLCCSGRRSRSGTRAPHSAWSLCKGSPSLSQAFIPPSML